MAMDKDLYLNDGKFVAVYSFRERNVYVYLLKKDAFDNPTTIVNEKKWLQLLHKENNDSVLFEEFTTDYVKDILSKKESTVEYIYVEVNKNCNLKCLHCYVSEKHPDYRLSLAQFDRIINNLQDKAPIDIRLIGGEPGIHSELVAICRRCMNVVAKKRHILLTNCTMDEKLLKAVIATGITLQVSVYGMSFETYHAFSKGSRRDYDNLFRNLELLSKEYRDKVKLVYICTDITKPELNDFIGFAQSNQFNYSYGGVMLMGRAEKNQSILGGRFEKEGAELPYEQVLNNKICDLNRLCVFANGDVTPCPCIQIDNGDLLMGNVFSDTISDIMESKKYKQFKDYTVDDVNDCRRCVLRYLCSAGCCGETFSVTGNVLGKYTQCCIDKSFEEINDNGVYRVRKVNPGVFKLSKIE